MMIPKCASMLVILMSAGCSLAGVVTYDNSNHQLHDASVASSFMHFHGPVEGPEFEVKLPYIEQHEHQGSEEENKPVHEHGYVMDYVAHPKYQFSYGVEDHHTGDFHSQKESRDGSSVSGEYSISEPGGGVRVVSYRADKDGFHAVVKTTGKNDHSGGTYGYGAAGQQHESTQLLQEYPSAFSGQEETQPQDYR